MRLPPLTLRDGDREVLKAWSRAGTVEARMAKRARIMSLAADGLSNRHIGEVVDLHYNQVGMWRKRYEEYGLAGLDSVRKVLTRQIGTTPSEYCAAMLPPEGDVGARRASRPGQAEGRWPRLARRRPITSFGCNGDQRVHRGDSD